MDSLSYDRKIKKAWRQNGTRNLLYLGYITLNKVCKVSLAQICTITIKAKLVHNIVALSINEHLTNVGQNSCKNERVKLPLIYHCNITYFA